MQNYPDAPSSTPHTLLILRSHYLRVTIFSLLLILLLFGEVPRLAAESGETVTARIAHSTREKILIGDPLKLKIDIHHRAGTNYQLKIEERGLEFFELRGQPIAVTRAIDGQWSETEIELTIVPFRTGKLPFPPLLLARADGGSLQTPSLEIQVDALTLPPDNTIKDVRLIPNSPNNGWLQVTLFSMMLATAALYLVLRTLDARIAVPLLAYLASLAARKPAVIVAPTVGKTLEEETIEQLRALLASGLAQSDLKSFHVKLAEIITDYAIARYRAPRQEYTTPELLELFHQQGVPVLVTSSFEQILTSCDLVKFARWQSDGNTAERHARQAIDLLKALNLASQNQSQNQQQNRSQGSLR